MAILINVADMIARDDPQGRTYRQINEAKTHGIPVGTLVEIIGDESERGGVRLFVVAHHRDCDGTPLYAMAWDTDIDITDPSNPRLWGNKILHGYPEDSIVVIYKGEVDNGTE